MLELLQLAAFKHLGHVKHDFMHLFGSLCMFSLRWTSQTLVTLGGDMTQPVALETSTEKFA